MKRLSTALLFACHLTATAQWEHTGPFGAWNSSHVRVNGADLVGGTAGIFKSTDGAQTWSPWGSGLPSESIMKLHKSGAIIFAGVDQQGLYRSLDEGLTWSPCNNAALGNPYDITAISDDGTNLLVACNQGRFRSSDQGLSFTALGSAPNYPGEMIALGGNVIITRGGFNTPGNVYRSVDNGATWQLATNGFDATPGIGALYTNGTDVYAFGKHVYRSTDQGQVWTQLTTTPIAYSPKYSCRIGDSFYFSSDGNTNVVISRWDLGASVYTDIAPGLPDTWTTTLFSNATGHLYINKNRALYRSTDQGATWVEQNATGMIGAEAYSLLVEGDLVLCGSYEGIHRSTDAGVTWQRVASPQYAYVAGLRKNGNVVLAATGNGLLRSTDGGITWPNTLLAGLALGNFTDAGGSLFVGGSNAGNATVQRSTDGGGTWSDFSTGLPGQAGVLDVFGTGTTVFAGIGAGPDGDPGVYRSAISTAAWTHLTVGIEGLAGTAFAQNMGYIYLGTENGVYRSDDQGTSWNAIGASLAGVLVNDLIVLGTNVVAATEDGIYLLPPGANDWNDITGDLLPTTPLALATGIGNNFLYAATQGRSVARRELTTVGVSETSTAPAILIGPNPVSDELWIHGEPTKVSGAIIHDMTGREVKHFSMIGRRLFDVSDLVPGIYTLSLTGAARPQNVCFIKQ